MMVRRTQGLVKASEHGEGFWLEDNSEEDSRTGEGFRTW